MKPISHQIIEKLPFPGFVTGLIISLTCSIGYYWFALNSGLVIAAEGDEPASINIRANLTLMILAGYLPTANWYLRQWTRQGIETLNRRFELKGEFYMPGEKNLLPVSALGALAFVFLFQVIPGSLEFIVQPWLWDLDFTITLVALSFVGWWTGRFFYELASSALQLSRLATQLPELNLLDDEAFKPFTHQGVQSSLLIVIMMSITGNIAIQPGSGFVGAIVFSTAMLVLAIATIVLPMRGIHRQIKAQKLLELKEIRRQIQSARKNLVQSEASGDPLLALLAMESRIERVPEWPFDIGNFSRVTLYLMLGLGSWVGAALVERVLESTW